MHINKILKNFLIPDGVRFPDRCDVVIFFLFISPFRKSLNEKSVNHLISIEKREKWRVYE
jgi:hypothetical protein